jgi:hypothetical protein
MLSEVTSQWRQLEGEFDQKQAALTDAKQRAMRTSTPNISLALSRSDHIVKARLHDAYERERDSLAAWLADERRELTAALSLPVEHLPQVLSSFRARKVEQARALSHFVLSAPRLADAPLQGIPILDRVQELHSELAAAERTTDDADLKVAEDAWDVLLLLVEAVERNTAVRSQVCLSLAPISLSLCVWVSRAYGFDLGYSEWQRPPGCSSSTRQRRHHFPSGTPEPSMPCERSCPCASASLSVCFP